MPGEDAIYDVVLARRRGAVLITQDIFRKEDIINMRIAWSVDASRLVLLQ